MPDSASSVTIRPGVSSGGQRRRRAVLITGAGGEVGHGLIEALAEEGEADVVALDLREMAPALRGRCAETIVGDITDSKPLERIAAHYEISEVFHLAALLSTRSEFAPETAHAVNVDGTLNLLRFAHDQARSHGRPVRFIYPSSIAAYGLPDLQTKEKAGGVREDDHLEPITMYGCNKLACEHLGRYYARHYRQLADDRAPGLLDFRCVRYPGLISSETAPSGGTSDFGPEMIHAAAQGEAYACFVRADARLPFMTMSEAVEATLALARADRHALSQCVYNIGAFSATAGQIAEIVKEQFPEARIDFAPDEARQAIVDSWPADVDCSVAERDWGFERGLSLREALVERLIPRIRSRYA